MTFALRDPNSKKPTPLTCWVYWYHEGERVRWKVPTGLRIEPRRWDQGRRKAKKGTASESLVNDTLRRIEQNVSRTFAELQADDRSVTRDAARDHYAVVSGSVKRTGPRDLFTDYDTFIAESAQSRQRGTLQIHRTVVGHLNTFADKYAVAVTYGACSVLFFDKFLAYLVNVAGVNNQTAWKLIRTFRVFLRHAVERGWTDNAEFQRFTGRKMPRGESSEKVYVTAEELARVRTLNLAHDERLAITRDLFLFQAWTGLRYGDVQTVTAEHVVGDELRLVTGKNRKSIRVPLFPPALEILHRHGGRLPRRSNQKQNSYLKELMRLAGITRPVVVVDYRGTRRVERTVDKCDLISTHSCKRSFVSILRQHNVSIETICRLTGNSRTTIERYVLKDETDLLAELKAVTALL